MTIGPFGATAIAGPIDHLMRAELALKPAAHGYVTERLPGGRPFNMDDSAPNVTEVIVGSEDYMLTAGQVMQLPPAHAATMARTAYIHLFDAADRAAVRSTPRSIKPGRARCHRG